MKNLLFKSGMPKVGVNLLAIAFTLNLASCTLQTNPAETTSTPEAAISEPAVPEPADPEPAKAIPAEQGQPKAGATEPSPSLVATPPASEVVPSEAKQAAATLTAAPLPLAVQPYSSDELFAEGGGGCGMSLWLAEGSYGDSLVLFNGIGDGPQLLMKLDGKFVTFERMEGSGKEFYGQFTQQRFRNLNGDIEVMTEVKLGAQGEIESVAINQGRVVVTQDGVSQEIAVKGDAGC